jgi:hypothetical protein
VRAATPIGHIAAARQRRRLALPLLHSSPPFLATTLWSARSKVSTRCGTKSILGWDFCTVSSAARGWPQRWNPRCAACRDCIGALWEWAGAGGAVRQCLGVPVDAWSGTLKSSSGRHLARHLAAKHSPAPSTGTEHCRPRPSGTRPFP